MRAVVQCAIPLLLLVSLEITSTKQQHYILNLNSGSKLIVKIKGLGPGKHVVYTNSPIPHSTGVEHTKRRIYCNVHRDSPHVKTDLSHGLRSVRSGSAHEKGLACKPLFWHGDNSVIKTERDRICK